MEKNTRFFYHFVNLIYFIAILKEFSIVFENAEEKKAEKMEIL